MLARGWDAWKGYEDAQAELARATRTVLQESETNIRFIDGDLALLAQDDSAADSGQEVVEPLSQFVLSAGETAYLRGSFEATSIDLAVKVRQAYIELAQINGRIQGRELYRIGNGAMSNFGTRRKIINQGIRNLLSGERSELSNLVSELSKTLSMK